MHGKCSTITILDKKASIYKNIPLKTQVGRYHSWAIDLFHDKNFRITAVDDDNVIMSFQHKIYHIIGIQYHPESILTEFGQKILTNWLISSSHKNFFF